MKNIIKILGILLLFTAGLDKLGTAQIIGQCTPLKLISVNTGINTLGANLSMTGAVDPYWQLTNVAPPSVNGGGGINIPNAYTILSGSGVGFPNWCEIPGVVSLNVIPSYTFGVNNLNPSQPWKFRRKFSITAAGTITVAGKYIGDDQSELHICDPTGTVLFTDNQAGWSTIKQFSKTLTVTPGCYFIEIELTNVGSGLMGFAVQANITSPTSIVANPSQLCCNTSTISGQKWIDNNCDGILNAGDTPGVGWVFNLLSGSSVIQTATTDAYGQFYFNNVSPGTYTISEVNQIGYYPKNPLSGTLPVTITSSVPVTLVTFLNCKNTTSPCQCGQWGSIGYTLGNTSNKFNCNGTTNIINANLGDVFSLFPSYTCAGGTVAQACNPTFSYDVYYANGGVLLDVKNIKDQKIDSCGDIRIVMKVKCGNQVCPPCEVILRVNCCQCAQDPKPYLFWTTGSGSNVLDKQLDLKCGETYTDKLKCFQPYIIKVQSPCGASCQPDSIITTIQPPTGPLQVSYSLAGATIIANQVGTYIVTIKVKCGGKWCAPCVIRFIQTQKCEPPCDNCKDKVSFEFDSGASAVVVQTHPTASTLNATFVLGGGADTYTQLRINVVDFQVTSDNPACLQCYNMPNQWGSILGGTVPGFTPLITTYPGVGSANANNNPREIIFSATTPAAISMGTNLNLSIKVPGVNPISCCCIKVVLYIKITYRNNKCEECTKIVKVGFTECPGNTGDNGLPIGTGTSTFDPDGGHPQFRMHAPNNEDAQILNSKTSTKSKN